MSNMILCKGGRAKNPYHFALTGTNIYSIEELCYYVYNNIYSINEEIFDYKLVDWLKIEVGMDEIALKLSRLIDNKNNLKDIVVSILCSADYYNEQDIKEIIEIIDAISGLPEGMKLKIKADNYLKYGYYSLALKEYESILSSPLCQEISPSAVGDIYHNMGIVKLHTSSYRQAALSFKEAYSKNCQKKSLMSYLTALKLDKADEEFEYEVINYALSKEEVGAIVQKVIFALEEAKMCDEYIEIEKIEHMKGDGRVSQFYKKVDERIDRIKNDYKDRRVLVR